MLVRTLQFLATVEEDKPATESNLSRVVSLPAFFSKNTFPPSDKKHTILLPSKCCLPFPFQGSVYKFLVKSNFGGPKNWIVDESIVCVAKRATK